MQSKIAECDHANFATTNFMGEHGRRRCDTEVGDDMHDGDMKSPMDESPKCASSMVSRSDIQELALSRRGADPVRRACDGLDPTLSKACLRARSSVSHLEIDGLFVLCCRTVRSDLLVTLYLLISDSDLEVRSMLRRDRLAWSGRRGVAFMPDAAGSLTPRTLRGMGMFRNEDGMESLNVLVLSSLSKPASASAIKSSESGRMQLARRAGTAGKLSF